MKTDHRLQTTDQSRPQVDGAFLAALQNHDGGACLSDLSEELRKVTEAVLLTGKAGSLSLKLTIKPASSSSVAVVLEDDIKTTLPKLHKRASIHFVDSQHNLLRDNPKQLSMELKVVEGDKNDETTPLRVAVNQ